MRNPSCIPTGSRLLVAAACVLLASRLAMAQSDETPVYGARQRPPVVDFERITGDFSLTVRASKEEQTPKTGDKTKTNELIFEEALTLRTNGYVVTPRFAVINLSGRFGLNQDYLDQTDRTESTNSTIYEWDTSATFLQDSSKPLTLYSSQSRSLVDRSFGSTLEDTTTTYGALWQLRSPTLPTELRVYRETQTQSALNSSEPDFNIERNAFDWHTEYKISERQHADWNYHLESTDQNSSSGVSETSTSQSASLTHSYVFADKLGSSLDSGVSWSHVTGLFPIETERWSERLRLRHTRKFETNYEYSIDRQDYNTNSQIRQRGVVGFRHQLYESLTTIGRTGWQQIDLSDDSQTTNWFDTLDFNYNKKIPYGLMLDTLSLSYDRQNNTARQATTQVQNQPLIFTSYAPVIIQQRNIVPSSVVIRDATGQLYLPGDGYTVIAVPNGVQIQPEPGGPLPLNEPLFLFYDIGPAPANIITSRGLSISIRYEIQRGWLKGVSPYARYGMIDQDVEGGMDQVKPNSSRSYIYGVDYRVRDFRFKAEREIVESDLFPYDTTRYEARYDHRATVSTTISLSAIYSDTHYTEQNTEIQTLLVNGGLAHQISRNLTFNASAAWVNIDDNTSGMTNGWEEELRITWQHRQTEIYGRVRNATLDTDNDTRSFQFLEVGIRREF